MLLNKYLFLFCMSPQMSSDDESLYGPLQEGEAGDDGDSPPSEQSATVLPAAKPHTQLFGGGRYPQ